MPVTVELIITAFLAIVLVSQLISQRLKMPYTLVLVIVGVVIAVISTLSFLRDNILSSIFLSIVEQLRSFYIGLAQEGLFIGLVVPPLIFEAMIHIRREELRKALRPSLLLATAGVIISTIVSGLTLWYIAGLSFGLSFLFGAIIAPTDVVTVLELFRRIRVPKRLAAILDLEAAFNDATAIVVFSIVISSLSVSRIPVIRGATEFSLALTGGVVVGLLVGLGASRLNSYIEDTMAKIILTVSAVYGSYAFATGLGFSGLIAVAVVGLYFGNSIVNLESEESRRAILTFWEIVVFLGNSVAFLFISFQTDLLVLFGSISAILIAYLTVLIARFVSVYPIFAILTQLGDRIPISWSNAAMLGSVRGAISIALVTAAGLKDLLAGSEYSLLTDMVVGVVFISIVLQIPLLLRYAKTKLQEQI